MDKKCIKCKNKEADSKSNYLGYCLDCYNIEMDKIYIDLKIPLPPGRVGKVKNDI